jgi:hypothetical protein
MRRGILREKGLGIAFLAVSAAIGFGQNSNSADIRGTVTDATGAVVPGVGVRIVNVETGTSKDLVTNDAGIYDAVSVLPGKYELTFTKQGFDKLIRGPVTLTVGTVNVDVQLKIGSSTETVSVNEEAPMLKTESAEQSTSFQAQTMAVLPNVGQNWANFTKLIPGASGAPSASQGVSNPGTGISVNGNLPYYANFLADGASTTLPHSANVDVSIFETLQEVQINTANFSAQYGIGGVVFNQISKGGTNQWHGSAYEYFQNDALNARSFFDKTIPRLRYDNFGGSIAGPILKNRLFFYFNIDKIINPTNSTRITTVPTDAMRAGNFSDPAFARIYDPNTLHKDANGNFVRDPFPINQIPADRFDSVAKALQAFYPSPTDPGLSNNYRYVSNGRSPFIKEFGRIDYNLQDNNRITFSITQRDNPSFSDNGVCPYNCQNGDVDSYNAQVSDVWSIKGSLVNEFRFGYTKQGNWFSPTSAGLGIPSKIGLQFAKADILPNINIQGPNGNNVLNPQTNAIYIEHSFTPSDIVTLIKGKHILHFGGEVLIYRDNSTPWGNLQSGQFNFTGVFTQSGPNASGSGISYADFLLGQVQNWNVNNQSISGARQKSPQVFVQDDIKLRPNLTLNLGLRYQMQGGWSEVNNKLGSFDPTLINPKTNTPGAVWFAPANGRRLLQDSVKDIFLPRVGFAWSPGNAWSVRGGFGIFAYGWSLDTYAAGIGFGSNSTGNFTTPDNLAPAVVLSGTGANLPYVAASKDPGAYNGQGGIPYQKRNTPVARNYQWTLSIQREFARSWVGELAYVGSNGTNLPFNFDANQVPVERLSQSLALGDAARPFPQFQGLGSNSYNAISNYQSLQLQVRKRFSNGLNIDANYTWSKFLDEQDSAGWGSRGGTQNWQNGYVPGSNYGFSNFDHPHMAKAAVVYELPFGRGRRLLTNGGVLDALFGGWQASSIFVAQSGSPFNVTMSGNNGSNSKAGNWFPNLIGDPNVSNPTIDRWFNQAAFAAPAPNTFGSNGRNNLRGPRLVDLDFSLGKNLKMPKWERASLQLRFDATNFLNHPSFSNPNAAIDPANSNNPAVGRITSTTMGGRQLQLGARFSF